MSEPADYADTWQHADQARPAAAADLAERAWDGRGIGPEDLPGHEPEAEAGD